MSRIKRAVLVQPASAGGNFEYIAIPRQGMLFLSGALGQWEGPYLYERQIWFEDRSGLVDPDRDLDGVDVLMLTALINEAPRAYQIARLAKQYHPNIVTIGGGPQMSPLPEEAFHYGDFDVIVQREGEDIIGPLCDVLLSYQGETRYPYLERIPGISYQREGRMVQTVRAGLIAPDFVQLPDFRSVKDLTPRNPLAGGVMETVRGCTEKCTYCQVIEQFKGYRMVQPRTEFKRLEQLRRLAEDGLILTSRRGKFNVFISDDLHPPPLRARNYRHARLSRLRSWKGKTDDMFMICQCRAEVGQDPELAAAMGEANIEMLYVGVESDNAENLKAVRKRQDPSQVHRDLSVLKHMGFDLVAMTIIGLPFDTEESIMNLADWITKISKYQIANLLTPLPATSNWEALQPLNERGEPLQEGEMRPYHLYTGRQFVHHDQRWSMQESRALYERYSARLNPIDKLYERAFRMFRAFQPRMAVRSTGSGETLAARTGETMQMLRGLHLSLAGKEVGDVPQRAGELIEAIVTVSQPLANARRDLAENISNRLAELTDSLRAMSDPLAAGSKELAASISARITELTEMLYRVMSESSHRSPIKE